MRTTRSIRSTRPSHAALALVAAAVTLAGCELAVPKQVRKVDDAELQNLPAVVTAPAPADAKEAAAARAQIAPRKNAR